jgi:hypothetical protein
MKGRLSIEKDAYKVLHSRYPEWIKEKHDRLTSLILGRSARHAMLD